MLNGVVGMQAQVFEIELVLRIGLVEEAGGEVGDEEAEGRGEVEGFADFGVELLEGDVLAVVGKDAVVCCSREIVSATASTGLLHGSNASRLTHGIQHWAC